MKKRVLSFALALLLFVMIPAETVMAMPAAQAESVITLTEEVEATEDVVDDDVVEDVEPTEAPVEEEVAEETEEPEAEVEATEEPTAEATEAPAEEEVVEPTAEPEATVVPEATPEPEATEEPTVEATEEPTAEVEATEEPEATATEEPSATPSAEPTKEPAKKDVQVAGRDLTAKVVGSNGIQYDNVEYLSVQAVNSLSSEGVDAYIQMCDDIAALQENGEGIEQAVLSLNKKGELSVVVKVPTNTLFSADIQEELLDGLVEETEEVTEEPAEEAVETEEVEEAEESAEEAVETEVVEEEVEENEEATDETAVKEFADVIIEENVELAQACEIPEEIVGEVDTEYLDTKMSNANYFKNQLSGDEKGIWNAGYSSMVKGGKNTFSYRGGYLFFNTFGRAISALNITYPNSFNWMQAGGTTSYRGTWSGGKYNYTVTVEKSSHYKSSLEKDAKAKVKQLVAEAKADATKNYPGNHVYGMVKYFDSWIRNNNYYNNVGTDSSKEKTKEYFYCHSCYGILLEGYGVCESYALAMTRLLDAAGIRNIYITGYAGGGHAWNYVQMPNGKWYLLDTTWNDSSSSNNYVLIGSTADNGTHDAHGYMYSFWSYGFKFPSLDKANYNANTEKNYLNAVTLNKSTVGVKPGKTYELKVKKPSGSSNYFFNKYPKSWTSSNTNVAKVSSKGKITAVAPGKATITYTIDGIKKTCTVYVYQFTSLKFTTNNKTSYKYTYANQNLVFGETADINGTSVNITVNQKNSGFTAAQLQTYLGLKAPKVKSSNTKVATATATLSGNTIKLTVTPKKVGSTKITVTFAGKTATYNLTNKYQINGAWFDYTKITAANNTIYSGKAITPKVKKTTAAPKGLEYSVSYKNNKNAGTATVTIKGKGSYTGKIEKTFKIVPKSITTAKFKSCSTSKTYNGAAQKATTTVMMGKTKLKAGKDYIVNYNNSTTVPTNVGKYTVKIVGTGNYTGTVYADNVIATKVYEIKPLKLDKATITCTASRKYTGSTVKAPTVTVKYGKKTIPATQYTITYTKNGVPVSAAALKDKGTYKVIITPKGSNFVAGTKTQVTKTFKIVKK